MGFGRTLETDWVGLGPEMGLGPGLRLVGVHAGGVGFRLLYLHGGLVWLEGCDGAGRGGQSVSLMTREEGASFRRTLGCVWLQFGWGRHGQAVVKPPDKNVIAF